MKKLLVMATALVAALTVNAATYDLSTITAESGWTVSSELTKNSTSTEAKIILDVPASSTGDAVAYTAIPSQLTNDIVFSFSTAKEKQKAMTLLLGSGFEFGGKNGIIKLTVKAGDKIRLVVASKGTTSANFVDPTLAYPKNAVAVTAAADLVLPAKSTGAEGADEQGYIWKTIEYQATSTSVEIKEFDGGYRIKSITIGSSTAVENAALEAKAVKSFENGQLVILKNGVKYNALGTVIE